MKKVAINAILALCAIALVWVCYNSIMGPINFDKEKTLREKAIIARLIDIRKAQVEYRNVHDGAYTDNLDTLIHFVKTSKIPFVYKEGVLTDEQMNAGMTEKKAAAIVAAAKRTGNWSEVDKQGLRGFSRDTTWLAVMDTIYPKGFNADSLAYVPFGNGAKFEMAIRKDTMKSGAPLNLFQAQVAYDVYLKGINDQELATLKDTREKLGKYAGLRVGDIEKPNNNAGNWE